jgi:hypothetical protein
MKTLMFHYKTKADREFAIYIGENDDDACCEFNRILKRY